MASDDASLHSPQRLSGSRSPDSFTESSPLTPRAASSWSTSSVASTEESRDLVDRLPASLQKAAIVLSDAYIVNRSRIRRRTSELLGWPYQSICKVCQASLRNSKGAPAGMGNVLVFHHMTRSSVFASMVKKCPICVRLWKFLQQCPETPERARYNRGLLTAFESSVRWGAQLVVRVRYGPEEFRNGFTYALVASKRGQQYRTSRPPAATTGSAQSKRIATLWLDNCIQGHSRCMPVADHSWYPTRLLDLGDKEQTTLCLVHGQSIEPGQPYMTLSHRWGAADPFRLTKHNLSQLQHGFPVNQLPLTFQHAVDMTRWFGARYLWIDSLCIIQDKEDTSDWAREAALMDRVFSRSFLTLAATHGGDCTSGLFQQRDPLLELGQIRAAVHQPRIGYQAGRVHDMVLIDTGVLDDELDGAPLHQRAWVLPERFLSPRTLHFGSGQLFWECRDITRCERYWTGHPSQLERRLASKPSALPDCADTPIVSPRKTIAGYETWDEVTTLYSNCQLTYASDKAVALSGIAKAMRNVLRDDYVAGMWRTRLESSLLWSRYHLQWYRAQRQSSAVATVLPYIAPTWSWLSVNGPVVSHSSIQRKTLFEVLDVALSYTTVDDTGQIAAAALTVRGRLRRLRIQVHQDEEPAELNLVVGGRAWQVAVAVDVGSVEECARMLEHDELFLMLANESQHLRDFSHVLLLKCADRARAVYHRFGLAYFGWVGREGNASTETLDAMKEMDEDEAGIPAVEYDAERHLHTFIME